MKKEMTMKALEAIKNNAHVISYEITNNKQIFDEAKLEAYEAQNDDDFAIHFHFARMDDNKTLNSFNKRFCLYSSRNQFVTWNNKAFTDSYINLYGYVANRRHEIEQKFDDVENALESAYNAYMDTIANKCYMTEDESTFYMDFDFTDYVKKELAKQKRRSNARAKKESASA